MEQDRIGLTTKISELEGELVDLSRKGSEIKDRLTQEEKERQSPLELETLQSQIREKELQIREAREAVMAFERESILKEAEALSSEKQKLLKRIQEIDSRGEQLRQNFEMNVPRRRVQISSQHFVRMRKTVENPRPAAFDISGFPVSLPAVGTHEVEDIISSLAFRRSEAAGWRLAPGEKIPDPEILDGNNSYETGTIAIPEIFFEITHIEPFPVFIPVRR